VVVDSRHVASRRMAVIVVIVVLVLVLVLVFVVVVVVVIVVSVVALIPRWGPHCCRVVFAVVVMVAHWLRSHHGGE
jgi:hypothetical protein